MATYYVATTGDDSNNGSINNPWYSWDRAMNAPELVANDTVYFRGGTWQPTNWWDPDWNAFATVRPNRYGISNANRGTAGNYIKFWNYPGEVPILDGSQFTVPIDQHYNSAIGLYQTQYLHFKGLIVCNINQNRSGVEAGGFGGYDTGNLIFENCIAHDCEGPGFTILQGIYGTPDTTQFINCDSYDNVNPYVRTVLNNPPESVGGIGDGFKFDNALGTYVEFINCRAWGNSDDQFDVSGPVSMLIKNCWAIDGGRLDGDGNGIKFGFVRNDIATVVRTVINCIAADNRAFGFTEANGGDVAYYFFNSLIYNNISYNNEYGFGQANQSGSGSVEDNIYRNNIAFNNSTLDVLLEYEVESNNTWRRNLVANGWAEPNPNFTVTVDDFISLDTSQLKAQRQLDGNGERTILPVITFGHLASDSDLRGGGIQIQNSLDGYDLILDGEGNPYNTPPSLGPFEYTGEESNDSISISRAITHKWSIV